MSLRNTKIGDDVVGLPAGLGKVKRIDESSTPICVEFENGAEWWYNKNGFLPRGATLTVCCWPISNAPEWVWNALGIKDQSDHVGEKDLTGEYHTDCNLLLAHIDVLRTRLAEADTKIHMLREYLEKLSCLGNGDRPGNSIGNSIAQEALDKLED